MSMIKCRPHNLCHNAKILATPLTTQLIQVYALYNVTTHLVQVDSL